MIKLRTVAVLATCVVAAGAVTGTALAAGADDPTPNPSLSVGPSADDRRTDGNPSPDDSPTVADSPSPEESSAGPAPAPSFSTVDAATARAIALRTTNGGRVVRIEQEAEHGRPVWDVRVLVGGVEHDLDIDRESGAVLRHEAERASGRDGRAADDDRDDDRGGHGTDDRDDDRGGHGTDDTHHDDRGGRR